MEGRLPPDDDLFEWTDSPARRPREEGTGEEERLPTGRSPGQRSDTGEQRRVARGDTGEFERSGRRPPPGRRARRRDLPARVRRSQDAIVGVVIAAVIIAIIVAVASGGGGGNSQPTIGLKRLVGQTIVAKLGKKGADQDLLTRIRQGRVGGLIAFPRDS